MIQGQGLHSLGGWYRSLDGRYRRGVGAHLQVVLGAIIFEFDVQAVLDPDLETAEKNIARSAHW
eukprot:160884-Rhodomonas_salina.1